MQPEGQFVNSQPDSKNSNHSSDSSNSHSAGVYASSSPYTEQECEEIISKLESLLDGELDEDKQIEVQKMISECGYCFEQYKIERSLKDMVKMGFQNFKIGDSIVNTIKKAITGKTKTND